MTENAPEPGYAPGSNAAAPKTDAGLRLVIREEIEATLEGTRAGRWHRPGVTVPTPVPSLSDPPLETVETPLALGNIADLTIDQLRRAAEAFGIRLDIEVSIWERRK